MKPSAEDSTESSYEELAELLKNTTWDLRSVLKIGLKLVEAIALLHDQKIVCKHMHPGSIMVSSDGERVKLKDISLAGVYPPDLHYISPEQTGRINRQVDSRSDLYSLGAVLYHLLSGEPPFKSADPLELIYAHLAREALDVKDEGGTADQIEPFEIALLDKPRILAIPNRLFGREKELEILKQSYQRVLNGQLELIFVSGYSGVGKTSLIKGILRLCRGKQGCLFSG